jgi:hypothetical protein
LRPSTLIVVIATAVVDLATAVLTIATAAVELTPYGPLGMLLGSDVDVEPPRVFKELQA